MQFNKTLATLACTAAMSMAQAAVLPATPITSQSSFLTSVVNGDVWVDNLEHVVGSGENVVDLAFSLDVNQNPRGSTITGRLGENNTTQTQAAQGRASHAGGNVYWLGGDGEASPFSVTFDSAVSAFGFWGSDIGDFVRGQPDCDFVLNPPNTCNGVGQGDVLRIVIKLVGDNNTYEDTVAAGGGNGNELFRGYVFNNTIESVTFINLTEGADGQGFDFFMVGQANPPTDVPEPAGLALAALGLLAAGSATRRRRI